MATYRTGRAARSWRRPIAVRVVLVLIGCVLFLVGQVAWAFEQEYGGDTDRAEYVRGFDETAGLATVYGEGGEIVFQAETAEEIEAWIEDRRGSRDFTVSLVLFVVAGASALLGIWPLRVASEDEPADVAA
ncbi:MAG TPA: hypothetical protein VLD62_12175 [Acidimicrobiia bacterium]|nr:hypothetical protein [Acidimicrobiia bacterium]